MLTVLIHLGYLAYNPETRRCHIPNFEVKQEMENAVEDSRWRIAKQLPTDILLVGINYDKKAKQHTCVIERVTK